MALYPVDVNERRFSAASLQAIAGAIFGACGMSGDHAALLAETLVCADLRGIHSHGVLRVPEYVGKLTIGGVDPRGEPLLLQDRLAVSLVDGNNSMGQIGGTFAMRHAISKARNTGIAAVALRGSNHCGAMDFYARMALAQGMIGVAMSNALPTMAPWGGKDKIVGINPMAVAFPAKQRAPIVLDIAFGATAHGKIRVYHQKGESIPAGWAFDADGMATTDAAAALTGLIKPIGDFKGVGLAMFTGVLSSVLSGAGYGTESGNMIDGARAGADGQFYLAIDIEAFTDADHFGSRIDAIIDQIHESRKVEGVARLYVPGEMENDFECAHRRDGIPLNSLTIAGIVDTAKTLRVSLPSKW